MARWPSMDVRFFRTLDYVVLSLVSISFASIALLALSRFDARMAVTAGLIVATAVRCFSPAQFDAGRASAGKPIAPVLFLVLLTGLLFRTEPFLYLHGGQDQGVYVSMSAHLQRTGSAFIDDPLPDALPDERSRDIYRGSMPEEPQPGSSVQPGVYYSPTQGDYVFQFYHLHPLWMATFGELFGDRARFHALGFFGLLGVLGLSLLAFELTGSRRAAFAAGMLAATNPLHVFLSRLPVSEAVALAFSSLGFYYLARAFRGARRGAPPAATATLVALAAAAVSLVFFVRITGFLYLPALAPLFGLGAWLTLRDRPAAGRRLIAFCAAVAGLYGASILYGLRYSPGYAPSVYDRTFGNLLGEGWPLVVAGTVALAVAGLAEVARNPRRPAVRRFLVWAADPRPWIRLGLGAGGGRSRGQPRAGLPDRLHRALRRQRLLPGLRHHRVRGGHLPAVRRHGLAAVRDAVAGRRRGPGHAPAAPTLADRPPVRLPRHLHGRHPAAEHPRRLPALLLRPLPAQRNRALHPGHRRRHDLPRRAGRLPHAGRDRDSRRDSVSVVLHREADAVREGVQPYAVMHRIADTVGDDVILFDVDGFRGATSFWTHTRLQTPLTYYFGMRVFPYYAGTPLDDVVQSFEGVVGSSRLWLLSPAPRSHPGLELREVLDYRDRRVNSSTTIPVTVNDRYWPQTLFLYRQRWVCSTPDCELGLRDGALYSMGHGHVYHRRLLGPGWHTAEERHVWSGAEAALTLSRSWFPAGRWPRSLLLEMRAFAGSADHRVTLTIRSGDVERTIAFDDVETRLREVPLACPVRGDACTVQLAVDGARSPRDVQGGSDARELGIALSRIGFGY